MLDKIREKTVKTRKNHTCFMCLRKFPAGISMLSSTIADTGIGIYTLYTCDTCVQLMSILGPDAMDEYPENYTNDCMDADGITGTPEQYLIHLKDLKKHAESKSQGEAHAAE